MKKLLLIMAITLGCTTPISAKMLWECSMLAEGETVGRVTRFKDTLILMGFNGETYQHSCIEAEFNFSKNLDVCIHEPAENSPAGVENGLQSYAFAIFNMENGLPTTFDWLGVDIRNARYAGMLIEVPLGIGGCKAF